jgi:hypothetical protein
VRRGIMFSDICPFTMVKVLFLFFQAARARLGSEPGIFWFHLFSHSITLPLSHRGSQLKKVLATSMLKQAYLFVEAYKWTMFWQDFISTFLKTKVHYYLQRGEKKKGFLCLLQKPSKRLLKCRLKGPSNEKIWVVLIRGGEKRCSLLFITPC